MTQKIKPKKTCSKCANYNKFGKNYGICCIRGIPRYGNFEQCQYFDGKRSGGK